MSAAPGKGGGNESRGTVAGRRGTPPPDQTVRDRIRRDLEGNFLVEAGAGSGKTTSLVDRMVAIVRGGACKVEEIAAVTFTRKAAAELRQRFQVQLESQAAVLDPGDSRRAALETALQGLDRAFLGTIHSFCARLLRERPLEAGLDPGFREVEEAEAARLQDRFWDDFLDRLAATADPRLDELDRIGVAPARLRRAFRDIVANPDVDFVQGRGAPAEVAFEFRDDTRTFADPRVDAVRRGLNLLLDRAEQLMRGRKPPKGWDSFGRRLRTLLYQRRALGWRKAPRPGPNGAGDFGGSRRTASGFFDALAIVCPNPGGIVQNRWADDPAGKAAAKQLNAAAKAFLAAGGEAYAVLGLWRAHRYPAALALVKEAAEEFADERVAQGTVTFEDLLVLTARLLREHRDARRALGRRYRRVLVDEFQDTDPIQAEIILLLASDPGADAVAGADWRKAAPRPGALFVVGDPKQSIYRFRRADISLYSYVKRRFEDFGEVLRLDANFRSLPAIGRLVDGVFADPSRFGREGGDRQAAFAPLRTQRGEGPGLLALYQVSGRTIAEATHDEAERIASSIAARVDAGERRPGDFMIITRVRRPLSQYARALESRGVPVQLSGAGVAGTREVRAFLLLLRCLADPSHEVRVLGVLIGPFFGLTLDEVVRFRDQGGLLSASLPPRASPNEPHADAREVADALGILHGWWERARREPADVTVERLADEIGLLPLVAAGTLGQLRAGTMVYLLDAVRARALQGDTSLAGAAEAVKAALESDDAEARLAPGDRNSVQLMNLHRAKGLQAPVVFLAGFGGGRPRSPSRRVYRDSQGNARGSIPIVEPRPGWIPDRVLAQPLDWDEQQQKELGFEKAEAVRLLYVAATRARDELWMADPGGLPKRARSPWEDLSRWIAGQARAADSAPGAVASVAAPGAGDDASVAVRRSLPRTPGSPPKPLADDACLQGDVAAAGAALRRAGAPTYALGTASERAKGGPATESPPGAVIREFAPARTRSRLGGSDWGTVAHAVLAAAAEGQDDRALARLARAQLAELKRPAAAHDASTEVHDALELVAAVRRSGLWRRSELASERHAEIPFAVDLSTKTPQPGPSAAASAPGPSPTPAQASADVVEGVIDLAFKEAGGWVVVDYKTDRGDDPDFNDRLRGYRAQVDLYATCWERLTGERVSERVLMFTSLGREESW